MFLRDFWQRQMFQTERQMFLSRLWQKDGRLDVSEKILTEKQRFWVKDGRIDRKTDVSERILTERWHFWLKDGRFWQEVRLFWDNSDRKTDITDRKTDISETILTERWAFLIEKQTFLRGFWQKDGCFWQNEWMFVTERWTILTESRTFLREFWQEKRRFSGKDEYFDRKTDVSGRILTERWCFWLKDEGFWQEIGLFWENSDRKMDISERILTERWTFLSEFWEPWGAWRNS